MATVNVTTDTFDQTVTGDGITLVDFWAEWCPPCKRFGPIFEKSSDSHADITFAKVDTDANPDISQGLQIESIPTIMAFRDGILVFRQAGALSGGQLEQLIGQVEGLNMDDVRAEVAAQSAGEPSSR